MLYENYFNIIHNRHNDVLLPLATGTELNAKIVLVCPGAEAAAGFSKQQQTLDWLFRKLFDAQISNENEIEHLKLVESFSLNNLDDIKYGMNLVLRVTKMGLTRDEIAKISQNRSLFGADSMIYVLSSLDSGISIDSYAKGHCEEFQSIIRLCNNNIRV